MSSSNFKKFQSKRESGDGISYTYIDIPEADQLSLEYESADHTGKELLEHNYEIHHIYVDCSEIANKGFPLDANPREPAETRQVKAMYNTLDDNPGDFVKKNNGVVVICSDINTTESGVSMTFSSGEGICNGGHTYFAIMTADAVPRDARLHFEVLIIPNLSKDERKSVITDIAKARNNSNQLERRSEADFLGYYTLFQENLKYPELVEWHENDSDANTDARPISAVQFLRLLKSIDIGAYKHPLYNESANTHKSLATSRSRFHNSWIGQVEQAQEKEGTDRPLQYLLPVVNDVMFIRDLISYSFLRREKNQVDLGEFRKMKLYRDYIMKMDDDKDPNCSFRPLLMNDFKPSEGVDLPKTLEVLFMGLFRSDLFWSSGSGEGSNRYIGWIMDPEELWNQRAPTVLEQMGDLFSDLEKDPKQFIRINAPFNFDLYDFGMNKEVRPPEILYDSLGHKYVKTQKTESAEYWMEKRSKEPSEVRLEPIDQQDPPEQAALYISEAE